MATYIHALIRQITGKKKFDQSLFDDLNQLVRVIDRIPHMIYAKDETGRFIMANNTLASAYGVTVDNLIGKTEHELSTIINQVTRRHSDDIAVIKNGTEKHIPLEVFIGIDKQHRFLETTKIPFEISGKKAVFCISVDVTQRENALKALWASENKHRSLYATMAEGMALHEIIYDENNKAVDYKIIDVNPAYEKIVGLSRRKVAGKLASKVYGVDCPPYLNIYEKVARTRKSESFETYFVPFGKHFLISVFSPAKGEFATVFTDITDRIKYDLERENLIKKLEDKNAELERFAYSVSHDLKSPLITIKGFLEVLETDVFKGNILGMRTNMTRINAAADKMRRLLDELLELSRIGYLVRPVEGVSSEEAVRDAIQLVYGRINECGMKIEIAPGFPKVKADHKRLTEVFQNLIDNSIKFKGNCTDPEIHIGFLSDGDSPTIFYVRDNGIGIEPQYFHKVFGLFEKLDAKIEGTGVGLALAKRIVETHGGKIWVESQGLGKGSTFYFTIEPEKNKKTGQ